jgi:hypothetical protein
MAEPRPRTLALALAALLAASTAAGEIYEWKDASGKKQFTTDLSKVPPGQRAAAEAKARARGARAPAPPASAASTERKAPSLQASRHSAETVALLRERLLEPGGAAKWGLDGSKPVQGVLMETGYANGSASLVALENGAASLYLSTGGGVIGGESIPEVRAAAIRMCELAARLVPEAPASPGDAKHPLPAPSEVRFLILTPDGVRTLVTSRAGAERGRGAQRDLFHAGHAVLTALREASEARGIQP